MFSCQIKLVFKHEISIIFDAYSNLAFLGKSWSGGHLPFNIVWKVTYKGA